MDRILAHRQAKRERRLKLRPAAVDWFTSHHLFLKIDFDAMLARGTSMAKSNPGGVAGPMSTRPQATGPGSPSPPRPEGAPRGGSGKRSASVSRKSSSGGGGGEGAPLSGPLAPGPASGAGPRRASTTTFLTTATGSTLSVYTYSGRVCLYMPDFVDCMFGFLGPGDETHLRRLFDAFDVHQTGTVDFARFCNVFQSWQAKVRAGTTGRGSQAHGGSASGVGATPSGVEDGNVAVFVPGLGRVVAKSINSPPSLPYHQPSNSHHRQSMQQGSPPLGRRSVVGSGGSPLGRHQVADRRSVTGSPSHGTSVLSPNTTTPTMSVFAAGSVLSDSLNGGPDALPPPPAILTRRRSFTEDKGGSHGALTATPHANSPSAAAVSVAAVAGSPSAGPSRHSSFSRGSGAPVLSRKGSQADLGAMLGGGGSPAVPVLSRKDSMRPTWGGKLALDMAGLAQAVEAVKAADAQAALLKASQVTASSQLAHFFDD